MFCNQEPVLDTAAQDNIPVVVERNAARLGRRGVVSKAGGAGCSQIGNRVVVHVVVLCGVGPVSAAAAILVHDRYPIAASSRHRDVIVIDLHIRRVLDEYLSVFHPNQLMRSVADEGVVLDYGVVADFVHQSTVFIVNEHIVFIRGVDVVGVGPKTHSQVVVDVVRLKQKIVGAHNLAAAALDVGIESSLVVE